MSVPADMLGARRKAVLFALLLAAALIGVALLSQAFGLGESLSVALFFATLLLALPFLRSVERLGAASGCVSTASRRYARRIMAAAFLYVVTLIGAIWLSKIGTYSTPVYLLIAVAPSFPIVAMIWAMARLLIEETDEYLRSRHIHHALIATGITLTLATVWGFLEQFNVVPHVASYWVFPAWAMSLGLSQCWSAVRS